MDNSKFHDPSTGKLVKILPQYEDLDETRSNSSNDNE
jgi:hypothetical protein